MWRALYGTNRHRFAGKWIIAVDEDIDPDNADALFWAMSYRSRPQHDLERPRHKDPGHGPRGPRDDGECLGADQCHVKRTFAPVALPKREFMERAKRSGTPGLPQLKPEAPWHGYDLGHWPGELARQAKMATDGDYFALGEFLATQRRSDVDMNAPVDHDKI